MLINCADESTVSGAAVGADHRRAAKNSTGDSGHTIWPVTVMTIGAAESTDTDRSALADAEA